MLSKISFKKLLNSPILVEELNKSNSYRILNSTNIETAQNITKITFKKLLNSSIEVEENEDGTFSFFN